MSNYTIKKSKFQEPTNKTHKNCLNCLIRYTLLKLNGPLSFILKKKTGRQMSKTNVLQVSDKQILKNMVSLENASLGGIQ